MATRSGATENPRSLPSAPVTQPRAISTSLPAAAASVPEARELAAGLGRQLMGDGQLQNLSLVVTELVSNAVRHSNASEPVSLAMTPKSDYLCVQVTDSGHGLVPRPGAIATEPGAGYGLFLVEQLTRRWGMTREGGRTRVWLEIGYGDEAGDDAERGAAAACA